MAAIKGSPDKYDVIDPKSILVRHYITHSHNRTTSIEEFNRDGEYMVKQRSIYFDALELSIAEPTDQNKLEAELIMTFLKKENERLRAKHWPLTKQKA